MRSWGERARLVSFFGFILCTGGVASTRPGGALLFFFYYSSVRCTPTIFEISASHRGDRRRKKIK